MSEETKRLEIAIYRRNPEARRNVTEVDIGPLLYALTEEPFHLANVREHGTIKLEIQRTHEWEFIIDLVVTGTAIFLKGALTELGKRFSGWLADRIGMLGTSSNPEVRTQGMITVKIDPSNLEASSKGIAQLLSDASEKNIRVQLVVEPGN